ncbi:30S ribosomal protein S4 [Ignavigranum ruoffiae]|uniref:Small ribosomal subunit protein uS4 n=1 Tax=Ignavigranum ruoffiae TaxID=89093 RepID=A0A1H9E558_9LACT|nr:30S ribosomal protein S4 [Ignavigranum ruoffiae]UPQ85324.1 30S ribosomal protein S4 [Ignavigranum ruoffiae]SEQ20876.1 small subunit ribosomal protein S4 [Ignavigranum ruoffiae]
MSRYTGPSWKRSRRLGISLTESGKELAKRPFPPGQHGNARHKLSEYGMQLQEKQKLRFMYGLNERQFATLFKKAGKMEGKHGENFMRLLETRLDNLVFRLGFAATRRQARQMVNHGHILVDGKRVDIPSYLVQPEQVISIREKSQDLAMIKENLENLVSRLDFVSYDEASKSGKMTRLPERSELNAEVDEALVVEYYNKLG